MQKLQAPYPPTRGPSSPPVFVADDGQALPLFPVGEDWGCKARDLARLLGYANDGKNLTRKITKDWKGELLDGVDFIRGFNRVSDSETPVSSIQAHEIVLTRSGINMVCILTRKPMGAQIRRWLAEDVMIQIAETGSYGQPDPTQALTDVLIPTLQSITTALQSITARLDAMEQRTATVETSTRIEHRPTSPRGRLYAPVAPGLVKPVQTYIEGKAQLGNVGVPDWGEWNVSGRQGAFRVIITAEDLKCFTVLDRLMWDAGVVRYHKTSWCPVKVTS